MVNEVFVVKNIHNHIKKEGLCGQKIQLEKLFTDPWKTWVNDQSLRPFQRFYVKYGKIIRHPDIVGQLMNEATFAVEAKGDVSGDRGLIQADFYRYGFNYSYVGILKNRLDDYVEAFAKSCGLGILTVKEDGKVNEIISPRSIPITEISDSISRQFSGAQVLERWRANKYNIPMHYLAVLHFIEESKNSVELSNIYHKEYLEKPTNVEALFPTLLTWGLIERNGTEISLTLKGKAIKSILSPPKKLAEYTRLRKYGERQPLSKSSPKDSSILRLILLDDPIVQLVISSLKKLKQDKAHNMYDIFKVALEQDQELTKIAFLVSKRLDDLPDYSETSIRNAAPQIFNSGFFYQFKSFLIHAGILKDLGLGTPSNKKYNPEKDLYQLTL